MYEDVDFHRLHGSLNWLSKTLRLHRSTDCRSSSEEAYTSSCTSHTYGFRQEGTALSFPTSVRIFLSCLHFLYNGIPVIVSVPVILKSIFAKLTSLLNRLRTSTTVIMSHNSQTSHMVERTFTHQQALDFLNSLDEVEVNELSHKAKRHIRMGKTNVEVNTPDFDVYIAMLGKRDLEARTLQEDVGREKHLADLGLTTTPEVGRSRKKILNPQPIASTSMPRRRPASRLLRDEVEGDQSDHMTTMPSPTQKRRHVTLNVGGGSVSTRTQPQRRGKRVIQEDEPAPKNTYHNVFRFKAIDPMKIFDIEMMLKIKFKYFENLKELGLWSLVSIKQTVYLELVRRFYGNMELEKSKGKTTYTHFYTEVKGLVFKVTQDVICSTLNILEGREVYPGGMNDT